MHCSPGLSDPWNFDLDPLSPCLYLPVGPVRVPKPVVRRGPVAEVMVPASAGTMPQPLARSSRQGECTFWVGRLDMDILEFCCLLDSGFGGFECRLQMRARLFCDPTSPWFHRGREGDRVRCLRSQPEHGINVCTYTYIHIKNTPFPQDQQSFFRRKFREKGLF